MSVQLSYYHLLIVWCPGGKKNDIFTKWAMKSSIQVHHTLGLWISDLVAFSLIITMYSVWFLEVKK